VSASFSKSPSKLLAEKINAALPQTQCTRCGYADCAAYAQAIADDVAPINQCPPGGAEGIVRLARITGHAIMPLNPEFGVEASRAVAVVDEAWCIGCTLCIDACPTDAILGSNKRMHTVVEAHCTGCELCLPVCPVDCIQMENVSGTRTGWDAWSPTAALKAQNRYLIHSTRLSNSKRQAHITPASPGNSAESAVSAKDAPSAPDSKQATIAAALARARARRNTASN
jgi:electron transport complex protein RnfB